MYDGRSRNLGLARSSETVLRLATPENGETIVNDLIREKLYQLEHFDGATYNDIVELETIIDKINGLHPRDRDEDQVLAEMKEGIHED